MESPADRFRPFYHCFTIYFGPECFVDEFCVLQMKRLTGSTADTYLEYVERNLPEGVAMKVLAVSFTAFAFNSYNYWRRIFLRRIAFNNFHYAFVPKENRAN